MLVVNSPPAKGGDTRDSSSISGLGKSPGEGHGNPLQYSRLENPMDRRAWRPTPHRVAKSRIWLKLLSTQAHIPYSSFLSVSLSHTHTHTSMMKTGRFACFVHSCFPRIQNSICPIVSAQCVSCNTHYHLENGIQDRMKNPWPLFVSLFIWKNTAWQLLQDPSFIHDLYCF